jgi:hypothetical protein
LTLAILENTSKTYKIIKDIYTTCKDILNLIHKEVIVSEKLSRNRLRTKFISTVWREDGNLDNKVVIGCMMAFLIVFLKW